MEISKVFNDFLMAGVLALQLGLAVPLGYHYAQPSEKRHKLRGWFAWPAMLIVAVSTAYLVAGVDYRVFREDNVWDVFLVTAPLLSVLAAITVIYDRRRVQPATPPVALPQTDGAVSDALADAGRPAAIGASQPEAGCRLRVCTSSSQYAEEILGIERDATSVDRMTKRVSAIFKDPSAVADIAAKRFGPGSRQADAYLLEHQERRRIFIENISSGRTMCRETYNMQELQRYFSLRTHGVDVVLERAALRRTVQEWLKVFARYDNYHIGLTNDPIPIKYQLYDGQIAVLHEAVGSVDGHRLNALIIDDEDTVSVFQSDFDHVWERIPREMRTKRPVTAWIRSTLLPLLR